MCDPSYIYFVNIMKQKIISSLIFSISALLPVPFILFIIGLIGGSFTSGINMIMGHPEIIISYMLIPAIVSFISAFLLIDRIKYNPNIKNNNRKSWVINSLLIVILSLFLWACVMFFIFQSNEKWVGFQLAFLAGTLYSWALYPVGLLAGYIVWRMKKKIFSS